MTKIVITLLHPSRGRAEKAKATLDFWLSKKSGKHIIEHILSVDENDSQIPKYKELFHKVPLSAAIASKNDCVVQATNRAAAVSTGHILVYLSDDFKCPANWDDLIVQKIIENGGIDKPLLLKVNDCLQPYKVAVLTIPIMTAELCRKLKYFWHPGYKSMFVDEDLYWTTKNNGWLIETAGDIEFPHEHCSIGKAERDETYIRSEANWDQGKELFAKRKADNFPLV